ncbi:MAG: hypothetical protein IJ015_03590 [Ruminococcus sp.]|nr:hypothetical protein [Ruminococcus sp.]
MKKLLSILLCVLLLLSSISVFVTSAYSVDMSVKEAVEQYEKETGEKVETKRYYFLMPNGKNGFRGSKDWFFANEFLPSWYNENADHAGVYWWDTGTSLDCNNWPGYAMTESDSDSVFYADIPDFVECVVFNNHFDGGMDTEAPQYNDAHEVKQTYLLGYEKGESDLYPEGIESFDNMIFVIDPDIYLLGDISYIGKALWGEWYYYYGDGCFGTVKDGNVDDCIRDDHDHSGYYEKFLEYMKLSKDDKHMYSGPLYSHYEENESTPAWSLVYGRRGKPVSDYTVYGVFDDYILYGTESYPSDFSYHVYIESEQKFYSIEDAWKKDLCGKEEIFTKHLLPKLEANLIGDAYFDNDINILDATCIQQMEAGINVNDDFITETHVYGDKITCTNDFDHDGVRSVMDATAIQQKLAGLR